MYLHYMHILISMEVIWDPLKAEINLQKHRVRFSDAETVLFDPLALSMEDNDAIGEDRYVAIGQDATNQILVVVYTYVVTIFDLFLLE